MYFSYVSDQLYLIVTLCFTFFIFAYTLCLNLKPTRLSLLGSAFIVPFTLACTSLLSRDLFSYALSQSSDILLVFILFVLLALKSVERYASPIRLFLLALPFLILSAVFNISELPGLIISDTAYLPLTMAGSLLNLYLLRKSGGNRALLFWALLCFMGSSIAVSFGLKDILQYLPLTLRATAFFLFSLYFHREIYSQLTVKVREAEKKIELINKNLDLEVKKRVFEIERSNEKLVSISKTDALTKAYNKAAILELINSQIEAKGTKEFSIIMFDIDNFKTINDTLGHIEGDKCIRKLAAITKNSIREIDVLGRYGGDEFIIFLPGASIPQARLIAERFRKKVAETEAPHFTVSIGLANYPNDARTEKELIAVADEGLYQSKRKGRNTISHRNLF